MYINKQIFSVLGVLFRLFIFFLSMVKKKKKASMKHGILHITVKI